MCLYKKFKNFQYKLHSTKPDLSSKNASKRAKVNQPPHCPVVKTLKLVIFLFLDFDSKFGFKSIIFVRMTLNF
jgi:hypothetical protein